MVSSRAAEWFDALSTSTGELNDRSHRSLPGRPGPHIQHGLLLEDPHTPNTKRMSAASNTIRVSRGIGGSTPRSPAAFVAMVHCTSSEVFATAFVPRAAALHGDALI